MFNSLFSIPLIEGSKHMNDKREMELACITILKRNEKILGCRIHGYPITFLDLEIRVSWTPVISWWMLVESMILPDIDTIIT